MQTGACVAVALGRLCRFRPAFVSSLSGTATHAAGRPASPLGELSSGPRGAAVRRARSRGAPLSFSAGAAAVGSARSGRLIRCVVSRFPSRTWPARPAALPRPSSSARTGRRLGRRCGRAEIKCSRKKKAPRDLGRGRRPDRPPSFLVGGRPVRRPAPLALLDGALVSRQGVMATSLVAVGDGFPAAARCAAGGGARRSVVAPPLWSVVRPVRRLIGIQAAGVFSFPPGFRTPAAHWARFRPPPPVPAARAAARRGTGRPCCSASGSAMGRTSAANRGPKIELGRTSDRRGRQASPSGAITGAKGNLGQARAFAWEIRHARASPNPNASVSNPPDSFLLATPSRAPPSPAAPSPRPPSPATPSSYKVSRWGKGARRLRSLWSLAHVEARGRAVRDCVTAGGGCGGHSRRPVANPRPQEAMRPARLRGRCRRRRTGAASWSATRRRQALRVSLIPANQRRRGRKRPRGATECLRAALRPPLAPSTHAPGSPHGLASRGRDCVTTARSSRGFAAQS
jgi:hypothetical protein